MTNQTQVSAELSEGTMTPADWLRACSAWLDFPDMKATVREHLEEIADELDTTQADMSGKTVMSEEAFKELHGKAERLSALEEGLEEMLRDAFVAGCTAVHENYQPDVDPDFTEAGYDYAKSTLLTKEQTRG